MTHKMRKTLIMIVMAALIICLMAASLTYTFTYGLYTGGKFDSEKSPYDDLIEFVGAREYTVRSPEELIQAIEDGYSNIVISEDAEQPFVITEGVTDVTANLVLNLNGNVVVRNSRNPMLDVQTNVSVVLVYDSTNNGAFYNPVGSSLMASGGSLTVGSGGYESGPRAEEYENKTAAGTLSQQPSDVTIYTRGGITSPSAVNRAVQTSYKKIEDPQNLVPATTGRYYQPETSSSDYTLVPADTFLIYTEEENCFIGDGTPSGGVTFEEGKLYVDAELEEDGSSTQITATEFKTPLCDVASCDFYYYYPVDGTPGTLRSFQKYAIVYGYWDVMKLASNEGGTAEDLREKGLVYPYGAVRMVEGEGIVRGGTFANHFDVANTYGIYAEGGRLSVSRNTTFGTTFSSGGEGVCIRSSGESAELTISGGDFSSEIGNTIEMLNGNMTVTKGSFTKTDCKKGTGDAQLENQTAIISLMGGTLNVSGAQSGDVTMTAGAENSTLENVFGIRAAGGGTVTTKGVNFNIYGDYSAGVLSYDGTIDLGKDTAINVEQSDQYKNGNNILLTSAGVSSEQTLSGVSENEEHPVNLSGGVTITSNGLGITARGVVNVKGGSTSTVTTTRGTGIYVNNGQFNVEKDAIINVNSTVLSGYSWTTPPESQTTNAPNIYNGVYVQGGSITSEGTLNVEHTGVASDANAGERYSSYAVSVESGNVTLGSGAIAGKSAGGIYVSGGELTAGAVTVSAGGTVSDDTFTADASTYASGVLVKTGTVTLSGAKIYSTALGVAVLGGNFKTEGTSSVTATRATGIYVQGGTVTNSGTLGVTSDLFDDSGNLYESAGADFGGSSTAGGNIYNGIFVNGGSLVSEGVSSILNVTFRGAAGDEPSSASGATKSYAVYVTNSSDDGATETTNTYASIREGALNAVQAGGVYLHGGDVVLGAQYNENDEVVGHGTVAIKTGSLNGNAIDSSAGTYGAGVFADNGKAVLYGTVNVDCAALGIVAVGSGGKEDTVSIAEDAAVTVNASRATGVYVQGGTVTNSGELDVTSTISSSWENEGADFENASFKTSRFNGIFVNGGSLESTGTLNVTHTGVENDVTGIYENSGYTQTAQTDAAKLYRTFNITSYAIRVEAAEDVASNVTIVEGEITNQVGGGILVNNTVSGSVKLGRYAPDAASNNLHVLANGTEVYGGKGVNGPKLTFIENSNWPYRLPKTGGPALKMSGGTLEVYGGTYQTNQGDGIVTVGGTSIIYDGKFIGADTYRVDENSPQAGPGASYAFKVYGGEANVYGGTFGDPKSTSGASGAFVMGTGNSETEQGTANIYGGTFEVSSSTNSGGQAAFSIYEFGKLVVTENGGSATVNNTTITGGKVTMTGYAAGLAIEENTDNKSTVVINSGTFSSTSSSGNSDGIWYGSNHADLTITGGTFKGAARSGLWFEYSLSDGKVQLSDGTYDGPNGAINANSPESINTKQIFKTESGGNSWLNDGNNDPIYYKHDWHLISGLNFGYYHDHVGGDQDLSLSSDLDTSSPVRVQALTDYDTIIVTTTQAPSYEE